MNRFHVHLGERRTTVSLDYTLTQLLALKLGQQPETPEAHSAIKKWIQGELDKYEDPGRIHVSQWIQGQAVLFMSDKILSKKYYDWILGDR